MTTRLDRTYFMNGIFEVVTYNVKIGVDLVCLKFYLISILLT